MVEEKAEEEENESEEESDKGIDAFDNLGGDSDDEGSNNDEESDYNSKMDESPEAEPEQEPNNILEKEEMPPKPASDHEQTQSPKQIDRIYPAVADKMKVTNELLEEEWWKKHHTPEGIYGKYKNEEDDIETRILNMDLVYINPKNNIHEKEERKEDTTTLVKKSDKNSELVDLGRYVLE